MTYAQPQPNRLSIGYERSKVLNPWVFADYGQPQRQRGQVSPYVYQTRPPTVYHPNLSGVGAEEVGSPDAAVKTPDEERLELQRAAVCWQRRGVMAAERMVVLSMIGASVALAGLLFTLNVHRK